MSRILEDIFGTVTNNLSVEMVRYLIKNAIYSNVLIPEAKMLSYREIAQYLSVGESIIRKAWLILKNEDQLIITNAGGGTYVVAKSLIDARRLAEDNQTIAIKEIKREILLNQETVLYNDPISKLLNIAWLKAIRKHQSINSEQRKVRFHPGLVAELVKYLKPKLGISFKREEVYYSQDYQHTLNRVCNVLIQHRRINVMLGPLNTLVKKTIRDVDKNVEWITAEDFDEELDLLEQLCMSKEVGFVYLSARISCPFNEIHCKMKIMKLLNLQSKFHFGIVNDDRHSSLYPSTIDMLLESAHEMKADLIHLMPLTSFHPDLNTIELIIGAGNLITKVRKKFRAAGKSISAVTVLSLKEILINNALLKHENIILNKLSDLRLLGENLFRECGLWKEEGLNLMEGWFFYLEPVNGPLPDKVFDLLAKENISVLDISLSPNGLGNVSVITISLAAYIGNKDIKNDIMTFNNVFKNLI